MPQDPDFFPYHPIKLRLFLLAGALVAWALTGWTVAGFLSSRVPLDLLRAGFAGGLGAAMALTWFRFRPREGWGVRITNLSVLVSKPRGGIIEVPWSAVRDVRRLGEKRDTLGLWLEAEQRVLVPSHLFARRAHFDALAARIDERRPAQLAPVAGQATGEPLN
jgi:hypothetical protein